MPRDLLKMYNVVSTPGRRVCYPHYNSDLEIAYFRTGRGVYSVTGREYPIGEGDIFICSNNEIHKITYVDPEVETRALNIHFPPRLLLMPLSLFPESGAGAVGVFSVVRLASEQDNAGERGEVLRRYYLVPARGGT